MTDNQISKILNDIEIIIDTREKKNSHITNALDEIGVKYVHEKLDSGDYSFRLPNNSGLKLDKSILIERKNSLDEIAQNFTKHRERFTNEFERVGDSKMHILIEGATWLKLVRGSYRSKLPPKSFMASLMTWNVRYDTNIWMCNKSEAPVLIYNIIYYGLREKLKNIQKNA